MIRKLLRYLWPRSVLGLVLFGFLLVGTPLIIGLLITGQQIERLTFEGERSLEQAVSITREGRETMDRVRALERSARQYRVLQDEEARASYLSRREALIRQVSRMLALDIPTAPRVTLVNLLVAEALLTDQVLDAMAPEPWPSFLAQPFSGLNQMAVTLMAESEAVAEGAVFDLKRLGEQARRLVYAQMAAVIPTAVVLALMFTGLITRPIRQLDDRIRSLAHPESGPIEAVKGPRDLRVLSVRLEWARRRLSRIERDRQRLLGQVSHELKTPLSAIREGVGLLEEELLGPLAARQAEVVAILRTSTDRLEDQIESLLRFNRIRAGLRPVEVQTVPVRELFDEALGTHALTISARNIRVETHLDEGVVIQGDPDMLRTALDNLLSNAIKFSPEGSRLGLSAVRAEPGVRIRVSDNGRGIESGDRYRVFEPFYRGRASAEGAVPGSGLGLSICRDLIRAHGGEVTLVRAGDWKTTFEIRFPDEGDVTRNAHAN